MNGIIWGGRELWQLIKLNFTSNLSHFMLNVLKNTIFFPSLNPAVNTKAVKCTDEHRGAYVLIKEGRVK